ncbi:MAG: hypothetical protein JO010_08765 [Alphaproteobacteria bacterium]|nr:hypothetical protein [Alphaproteobacteria bacterium]
MRRASLPFIALAAAMALGACANKQPVQQQPAQAAPSSGATSVGPESTSGLTNSPQSGSTSNAASGSSILQQEGPSSGVLLPQ